jgi:4'-phosphopantetheinyl transferase
MSLRRIPEKVAPDTEKAVFWQPVTRCPSFPSNFLHVWRFQLNGDSSFEAHRRSILSSDELARASRFHFPVHANRFITSRMAIRTILGAYLGISPRDLAFEQTQYGRPFLSAALNPLMLSFNLSHSQDLGVFAISPHKGLGIDVEAIREDFGGEDVAESHFAPAEFRELISLPEAQRPQAFFNCWTRKEAYVKALGAGLQIPLDSFEVSLRPGQPARFLRGAGRAWRLVSFSPAQDFQGAVAYEGVPADAQFFDATKLLREFGN